MDSLASGLTILCTIRSSLNAAKQLYDAPKELEELQTEVETFKIVLSNVTTNTFDLGKASDSIAYAVASARSCLLGLQQLIEFDLVKDVPQGRRARRIAWMRKVGQVHELMEKLSERRADVILALNSQNTTVTKRCEVALEELDKIVEQRCSNIEQHLLENIVHSQRQHGLLMQKLQAQGEQLEAQRRCLETASLQQLRLERLLAGAFRESTRSTHDIDQPDWHDDVQSGSLLRSPLSRQLLPPSSEVYSGAIAARDGQLDDPVIGLAKNAILRRMLQDPVRTNRRPASEMPSTLIHIGDEHSEISLVEYQSLANARYASFKVL